MYFAKYDNLSKNKKLLFEPLGFKIRKRPVSQLRKIFSRVFPSQNTIINQIIDDYMAEQQFIINNQEKILEDVKKVNFKDLYSKEHSMDNYLLDYIRDFFEINTNGTQETSLYIDRLKHFFYLNEMLFYIEHDMVLLAKKNDVIWIKSKGKYKEEYFRRWFALRWDFESQKAIASTSSFLYVNTPKSERIKAIELLTDYLLDKLFFANPNYVFKKYQKKSTYKYVYKLCQFFALMLIVKDHKISLNDPILDELEFKKNSFLDTLLEEQQKINILDKGLFVVNDEIYLSQSIELNNLIKCALFKHYNYNITDISSDFGDLFEDYICSYIKENMSEDYEIISDVINSQDIDDCEDLKLDIDLTIFDKKKNFYYFTQIKYTMLTKPYLKDEVRLITNNKALDKAISQLKNFPQALTRDSFVNRLKKHNINIENNNYALIVLHTSAQFDFQEVGKIKFYEWNTFRNLLDRGKQRMMHINRYNPTMKEISHSETLDLEDIKSVIETSIKNSPIDIKQEWEEFYWQYYDFEVNSQNYKCNIR